MDRNYTGSRSGVFTSESRTDAMRAVLARNWWALAIRGVLAIAVGLIALVLGARWRRFGHLGRSADRGSDDRCAGADLVVWRIYAGVRGRSSGAGFPVEGAPRRSSAHRHGAGRDVKPRTVAPRRQKPPIAARRHKVRSGGHEPDRCIDNEIDESLQETFPASDPPSR